MLPRQVFILSLYILRAFRFWVHPKVMADPEHYSHEEDLLGPRASCLSVVESYQTM